MEEEWVKTALNSDAVVASLLLRLKHPTAVKSPPSKLTPLKLTVGLKWGIKQARSMGVKKERESGKERFSPITPLSWSSNGDDEFGANKVTCTNNIIACTSGKKRSKRQKTDLHQQSPLEVALESYLRDDLNFRQIKAAEGTQIEYVPASNNINMYDDHVVSAKSFKTEKEFVVPDLNMMPSEDDSAFEGL